jgi:C1A family cysteine protease
MTKTRLKNRRFNCKPDRPDYRDKPYMLSHVTMPPVVDLRTQCPPIFDQGQEGSCTANGLAFALGFLELTGDPSLVLPNNVPFSRQFIYYGERAIEGTTSQDSGAMIRDGVKLLNQTGACSESTWPYLTTDMFTPPPQAAYNEAALHKITAYQRINGLYGIENCLATAFPVVLGFTVYENFESIEPDGMMPMPGPNDGVLGGHCVACVGYDQNQQLLICANSWGPSWGASGFFYMPYSYVNLGLLSDMWTLRK